MQFETTLRRLRDAGACYWRYAYLTVILDAGTRSDAEEAELQYDESDRYRACDYGDDKPISLQTIYDTCGYWDALWAVDSGAFGPEAKRFSTGHALQCCGPILHLMTDERSTDAIAVTMRHLTGDATDDELAAAQAAANDAAWAAADAAAQAAADAGADAAADAAANAAGAAAGAAADAAAEAAAVAAVAEQDLLFCDIFGLKSKGPVAKGDKQ